VLTLGTGVLVEVPCSKPHFDVQKTEIKKGSGSLPILCRGIMFHRKIPGTQIWCEFWVWL